MSNDAIYRQEAIKVIHEAVFDFFDIVEDDSESPMTYLDEKLLEVNKAITAKIKNLPSAQQWIPCSERQPEIDMTFSHSELYLVQYEDGGIDVAWWSNVNRLLTNHVTKPHWNCAQFQTVVAWMIPPEPWKGEDGDD